MSQIFIDMLISLSFWSYPIHLSLNLCVDKFFHIFNILIIWGKTHACLLVVWVRHYSSRLTIKAILVLSLQESLRSLPDHTLSVKVCWSSCLSMEFLVNILEHFTFMKKSFVCKETMYNHFIVAINLIHLLYN